MPTNALILICCDTSCYDNTNEVKNPLKWHENKRWSKTKAIISLYVSADVLTPFIADLHIQLLGLGLAYYIIQNINPYILLIQKTIFQTFPSSSYVFPSRDSIVSLVNTKPLISLWIYIFWKNHLEKWLLVSRGVLKKLCWFNLFQKGAK